MTEDWIGKAKDKIRAESTNFSEPCYLNTFFWLPAWPIASFYRCFVTGSYYNFTILRITAQKNRQLVAMYSYPMQKAEVPQSRTDIKFKGIFTFRFTVELKIRP